MTEGYEKNGIKSFSLEAHDKQFHKEGFDEKTMTCKFREKLAELDKTDDLKNAGGAHKHFMSKSGGQGLKNKGGVNIEDILSGQRLADAVQDYEIASHMVENAKGDGVKKILGKMLETAEKNLAGAVEELKDAIKEYGDVTTTKFSPNDSLPHEEKNFPDASDLMWIDRLTQYGGTGWHAISSGSTRPHWTEFNGKKYYVKMAGWAHLKDPSVHYFKDACKNEVNVNNFMRLAGIAAPDSKLYELPFGTFCVQEEADLSRGTLASNLGSSKIKEKAADAYPIMALLYNMDVMENADNAYVDSNNNPLFLDNGSTLGFSAKGARNKYFNFDKRDDPFPSTSTDGGILGLLNSGNSSARNWSKILDGKTSKEDVLKLCAKYDMESLVNAAEKEGLLTSLGKGGIDAFKEYAKKVDEASDKYRTKQTQQQPVQQQQANGAGVTQGLIPNSNLPAPPQIANAVNSLFPGALLSWNSPTFGTNTTGPYYSFRVNGITATQLQHIANALPPGLSIAAVGGSVFIGTTPTSQNIGSWGIPKNLWYTNNSSGGQNATQTATTAVPTNIATQSSPWNGTGINSYTQSTANGVNSLAQRAGVSVPTITKNANGTITISGAWGTTQGVQNFVQSLNSSGLFPGMTAFISNGQVAVVPTPSAQNMATVLNSIGNAAAAPNSFTFNHSGGNITFQVGSNPTATFGSAGASNWAHYVNSANLFPGFTATASKIGANGSWVVVLQPNGTLPGQPTQNASQTASGVGNNGTQNTNNGSSSNVTSGSGGSSVGSGAPSNSASQGGMGSTQGQGGGNSGTGGVGIGSSGSNTSSSTISTQSQQHKNMASHAQTYAKAINAMPPAARNKKIASLKKRAEDSSLPQNKRDAFIAILQAIDPSYTPSANQSGSNANGVPPNPFGSMQSQGQQQAPMTNTSPSGATNTTGSTSSQTQSTGTSAHPSWTKANQQAQGILAALQKVAPNANFEQGKWVAKKRASGGEITGLSLPTKGRNAFINSINAELAPMGLQAHVTNGGGSLKIMASNKSIANQALNAVGIATQPITAQSTNPQNSQPQSVSNAVANTPTSNTQTTNTTVSGTSAQSITAATLPPHLQNSERAKKLLKLINSPTSTQAMKDKFQAILDRMANNGTTI